jgi:hypothetical protein
MRTDNGLIRALLRKLVEIEGAGIGDGTQVQPAMEELRVPNGIVVEGYGGHTVDDHLKKLVARGLVAGQDITLGIFFRGVTDQGHAVLAECEA